MKGKLGRSTLRAAPPSPPRARAAVERAAPARDPVCPRGARPLPGPGPPKALAASRRARAGPPRDLLLAAEGRNPCLPSRLRARRAFPRPRPGRLSRTRRDGLGTRGDAGRPDNGPRDGRAGCRSGDVCRRRNSVSQRNPQDFIRLLRRAVSALTYATTTGSGVNRSHSSPSTPLPKDSGGRLEDGGAWTGEDP